MEQAAEPVEESVDQYAPPDSERPLAGYAVLAGVYGAAATAFLATLKAVNKQLPDRIAVSDLLLIRVGTHKISCMLAKDQLHLHYASQRAWQPGSCRNLRPPAAVVAVAVARGARRTRTRRRVGQAAVPAMSRHACAALPHASAHSVIPRRSLVRALLARVGAHPAQLGAELAAGGEERDASGASTVQSLHREMHPAMSALPCFAQSLAQAAHSRQAACLVLCRQGSRRP